MRLALLILISASLTGCFGRSTNHVVSAGQTAPVLPTLTAQQRAPCPPLDLLKDKTIGTLVSEDTRAAFQYAGCQARHESVVGTFDELVAKVNAWIASLKAEKEEKP